MAGELFADAFVLAVLNEAEELGLNDEREVADFVEEEGAAFAHGDASGVVADGGGECAFDVAEEFGFEEFGEREGQETVPKGLSARADQPWMARTRTPLPVPDSPRMRTVASVVATCWARWMARCMAGECVECSSTSGLVRPMVSRRAATFCSRLRIWPMR